MKGKERTDQSFDGMLDQLNKLYLNVANTVLEDIEELEQAIWEAKDAHEVGRE